MSSKVRVVKRYSNRKLYDTEASHYVTLDEIHRMVKDGEDVQIIDNRTKEDITSVTLAQIVLEKEKEKKSSLSLQAFKGIIREGGEFLRVHIGQPVTTIRVEAREQASERLSKLGEATEEGRKALKELFDQYNRTLEEVGRRIEDKVRRTVEGMTPPILREVGLLRTRIEELERRLEGLESSRGAVLKVPEAAVVETAVEKKKEEAVETAAEEESAKIPESSDMTT